LNLEPPEIKSSTFTFDVCSEFNGDGKAKGIVVRVNALKTWEEGRGVKSPHILDHAIS
jgi:hypothetical protein